MTLCVLKSPQILYSTRQLNMRNNSSYQRLFSPRALLFRKPCGSLLKRYQSLFSLGSLEQKPALSALNLKLSEKQENYINLNRFYSKKGKLFNSFDLENQLPIYLSKNTEHYILYQEYRRNP